MQLSDVFGPLIFDPKSKDGNDKKFLTNVPIRHLVIDNFLNISVADSVFNHFPKEEDMRTHYHGINEKKSEHSDFSKLHSSFHQLHDALSSEDFINWIQQITGITSLQVIEDRLGYGLHQGGNNSFLDIHIDYNLHPIKKMYRKLNLIIFFNPRWEKNWGGHLELWDAEVKNCIQSIEPIYNRCVIFECSEISYHGYSRITVPGGITRKSLYQYYFIPVSGDISFHDTIFKPKPKDPFSKKVFTYSKDFVKNSAKKILLKMGLKKFLK